MSTESLVNIASRGQIIREFCNHEGFKIFRAEMEKQISDARNQWLAAPSAEAAEQMRHEARGLNKAFDILKTMIVQGDVAKNHLQQNAQMSERQAQDNG